MKKKPLLFMILAFAHFFEPLVKVLYFKVTTSFSFHTVISNIAEIQTMKEVFEFWFLFPIGGLALLSVKRWGYPIFVGVQAYSIFSHLTYEAFTWPYVSAVPFVSSLALLFMNAMIMIYFALPDVRRPFFDQSVRWWETGKRYVLPIPMSFTVDGNRDQLFHCDILNLSKSGIFINSELNLEVGTVIKMKVAYKDLKIGLYGTVKSQHSFLNKKGLGVKFKFTNIWQDLYMRRIVREISKDISKKGKGSSHQYHDGKKAA